MTFEDFLFHTYSRAYLVVAVRGVPPVLWSARPSSKMATAVLLTAACGLLFNMRPDHIVPRAPAVRMIEPSEFQVSQEVSDPATSRRAVCGVLCAFSAWAFGTMMGTAAAMADETDELVEAEAAR